MRSNPVFCLRLFCAFFLLLTSSLSVYASHIVGGDLYYTHVSGSTYKVTLALYGDCGPASAGAFATLPSGAPEICIYDGGTYVTTLTLSIEPPTAGTEIIVVRGNPEPCRIPRENRIRMGFRI